jgi:hypothetical protein
METKFASFTAITSDGRTMQCEEPEWQHPPVEHTADDDDATYSLLGRHGDINTIRITVNPITGYFAVEGNGNKVHIDDMGFEAGAEVVLAIHLPGEIIPNAKDEPHQDELCANLRNQARESIAEHKQLRVDAVEAMQLAVATVAQEKAKMEENEILEKQAALDIIKLEEKKLKKAADRTEAERATYEKLKESAKLKMKEQMSEERRQLTVIADEDRQIKVSGVR